MHTPGAQFRLRCFRQTLSVSIFLLTFPWHAWTPIPSRADGPPSLSQIEALGPIRRCATDAAVIGIAISGCVVWSHGFAGSRPVYVCLQTIYGLNSDVFLSTLLHMPYPDQGVVWRSLQSVFTRLFTHFLPTFPPPRICASVC